MKQNRLKAATLTEVLIVLGIISTTLVVSMTIIINSLFQVRQNETAETATGIMVEALEIAKSSSNVYVSDASILSSTVGNIYYYSLRKDSQGLNYLDSQVQRDLIDCESDNVYRVEGLNNNETTNICLQLQIIPRDDGYYNIVSKVVYGADDSAELIFIKGTRYNEFTVRP